MQSAATGPDGRTLMISFGPTPNESHHVDHIHDSHDHSHSHAHSHSHGFDSYYEDDENEDDTPKGEMSPEEEEAMLFQKVVNAFRAYKEHAEWQITKIEKDYSGLSEKHRNMTPRMQEKITKSRECVSVNAQFLNNIVAPQTIFENNEMSTEESEQGPRPKLMDLDKVRTTLKQFMREWSVQGKSERDQCYKPLIDEIESRLPITDETRHKIRVLVPGGGLGRLAWEFVSRGYATQGNECSFHMLLSSNVVLNRTKQINEWGIFPYIHQWSNVVSVADQFEQVFIPDVDPAAIPEGADFSMNAGDFTETYIDPEAWDAIATCFFLDTAKNVIAYVETIYNILKPGGVWANIGPLLYHWTEVKGEPSLELSFEELREIVIATGFTIVKEEQRDCFYDNPPRAMMQTLYRTQFFVAIKTGHL